jgi:hypothetical protein
MFVRSANSWEPFEYLNDYLKKYVENKFKN